MKRAANLIASPSNDNFRSWGNSRQRSAKKQWPFRSIRRDLCTKRSLGDSGVEKDLKMLMHRSHTAFFRPFSPCSHTKLISVQKSQVIRIHPWLFFLAFQSACICVHLRLLLSVFKRLLKASPINTPRSACADSGTASLRPCVGPYPAHHATSTRSPHAPDSGCGTEPLCPWP